MAPLADHYSCYEHNHDWICKRDAASGPSCSKENGSREFGGWDQKASKLRNTEALAAYEGWVPPDDWNMDILWYFQVSYVSLIAPQGGCLLTRLYTQVLCVPQQPLLHDQSAHRRLWKVASPSRKQPKCDTLRNCWIYIENLRATHLLFRPSRINFENIATSRSSFVVRLQHNIYKLSTLEGCWQAAVTISNPLPFLPFGFDSPLYLSAKVKPSTRPGHLLILLHSDHLPLQGPNAEVVPG